MSDDKQVAAMESFVLSDDREAALLSAFAPSSPDALFLKGKCRVFTPPLPYIFEAISAIILC